MSAALARIAAAEAAREAAELLKDQKKLCRSEDLVPITFPRNDGSAPSYQSPELKRCLKAAAKGPEAWGNFCQSLPVRLKERTTGNRPAKVACGKQSYESKQSKINWCYNQFSN